MIFNLILNLILLFVLIILFGFVAIIIAYIFNWFMETVDDFFIRIKSKYKYRIKK